MGAMASQITSLTIVVFCLFKRFFRRRSNKTSKIRVTGLCEGNSPVIGESPAQSASNAENMSIWWRHHGSLVMFLGTESIKGDGDDWGMFGDLLDIVLSIL